VEAELAVFLDRQASVLSGMAAELAPAVDALRDFLAGGKRIRASFCYWGWRAAGGGDGPAIVTAAASLELLQASAATTAWPSSRT
jgi:geranylgeranyl diphosphate synthase type I